MTWVGRRPRSTSPKPSPITPAPNREIDIPLFAVRPEPLYRAAITQEYRDQEVDSALAAPLTTPLDQPKASAPSGEEATKSVLASYGAAELLNRLRWETHPEKILLLAAWHEARGGSAPWKSADMDTVFMNAKERPPANFPRDIKTAIKSGWIHTHTPRTYSVTRTGWNKISEALSKLH